MEAQQQLIRIDDVIKIVGLSKSEIWRRLQKGTFPKPIRLGDRCTRFELNEVNEWVREQIANRGKK